MLKDKLLSRKMQAQSELNQLIAINTERLGEQETAFQIWKQIKEMFLEVPKNELSYASDIYVTVKYAVTRDDNVLVLILSTYGTLEIEGEEQVYDTKKMIEPVELALLGLDVRQLSKVMDRVKQCAIAEEIDEIREERCVYCTFCYNLELDN